MSINVFRENLNAYVHNRQITGTAFGIDAAMSAIQRFKLIRRGEEQIKQALQQQGVSLSTKYWKIKVDRIGRLLVYIWTMNNLNK